FGGGFQNGSAAGGVQDGAALAAQGRAVVVRVNFRLGAFGFLHVGEIWGEPYRVGNVALLDACAALEWVRENIAPLGGDPDNVTLFGLSSGAFMTAALFGVPASRGLFHRAWMQSGSASRVIDRTNAAAQAAEFLAFLGLKPGDAAALQRVEASRILEAQEQIVALDLGERNAPGGRTLGIVDDGQTLTEHPFAVLSRGDRRHVPILLGTTREEVRLWFALGVMKEPSSLEEVYAEMIRFVGSAHAGRLFDAYRRALPQAAPARLRERFLTDGIYRIPAVRTASAHAAAGGHAYVYQFAWQSPVLEGTVGASHGFDEPFVWGLADPSKAPFTGGAEDATRVAAEMSAALLRFAAKGDPGWPAYSLGQPNTRLFGPPGAPVLDVDAPLLAVWEGVERR
ncbi:MAG: carboxylesterase/lipase family protein, partial [Verrucomicrobia bacterium]|nr:carboxylesterase/lipase family protein [Verrucomicrobiota bacterium]